MFHCQMLLYPKLKPLVEVNKEKKRLLLKHIENDCITDYIKAQAKPEEFEFKRDHQIELNYENYSMNEALKIIMKLEEKEVPSGFEIIGDIAHMNLNEKQFPFRYQVGQVVLDKNPKLRTVVCKIGQIESEFRFYNLECIAGEKDKYETI